MKQATTDYKREFQFLDAKRNLVKAEAEITTRNGYLEFTASGNYGGGCGQIFDHVEPANDPQKQFIELWKSFHLNGMNAGTDKQSAIVKDCKNYDECLLRLITTNKEGEQMKPEQAEIMVNIWNELKEAVLPIELTIKTAGMTETEKREFFYFNLVARYGGNEMILLAGDKKESLKDKAEKYFFAKENLLYDTHPTTGQHYRYGSEWLKKDLPEDFEQTLDSCIDAIEEGEEERKGQHLTEMEEWELVELIEEKTDFSGRDAELCAALVKMFDLSQDDLTDIEINGNNVVVQGTDYLAGTDEEMDEEWDDSLENYIDECILPEVKDENFKRYFDRESWKSDDGRGHALNRYDGGEEEQEINGTTYFAYQQ